MRKVLALAGAALAVAAIVLLLWPEPRLDTLGLAPPVGRYHVRILRDTWGVPHIFGTTDADVAYGLAYAHAEDDFAMIQGALLAARGKLATVYGSKAAPNDYMVQLLRVWDVVESGYATLSPETRAVCEAYADGINHYASRHPKAALVPLYPVQGKDIVAGFVHKTPLFFGLDKVLQELFEGKPADVGATGTGSNTLAVAPTRSADGATRLAINSHQPWEGPVAWYEVNLKSEQGWEMTGGVFPGSPVVLHGHNRHLGWAHTVNRPDLIDVYALEMAPENPNRYRFDGALRDLEVRTAAIKVKVLGPLSWTFRRETLWSAHGPVVRGPRGTFAIRYAGYGDLRQVEQWYRMNKARNLDEWLAAMRLQALPSFNCGYADERGNILYLYNARLPLRREGHDYSGVVPGNTSQTLWSESLPFDELPRVVNPASGFIQNCNSSPFETTSGPGNPDRGKYSPLLGIETRMTNRALRALELLGADESITSEEFEACKFDMAYSRRSPVAERLAEIQALPLSDDPLVREAQERIGKWDLVADPQNTAAALALLTIRPQDDGSVDGPKGKGVLWPQELLSRIEQTASDLKHAHGRLDVPWSEVNRLRRGNTNLGLGGAPDVLHAVYGRPERLGRLRGVAGDSYVLLVEWDREGRVSSRSIHQYGSATTDVVSRHFADQAPLFARRQLKPVWFEEAEVRAHLEREYSP
jgi:penicillin amidase/acyl-homoserine-lactone acylase